MGKLEWERVVRSGVALTIEFLSFLFNLYNLCTISLALTYLPVHFCF